MQSENKFTFTMAALTKLKPPAEGRQYVYDAKVAGLALCITANDSRSFYLYKKIDGRPERHHLGKFPEVTVEAARDHANKLLARIASGDNPAEAKRKHRGELTLGQLWLLYLEFHAEPHKKARTVIEDHGLWKRNLSDWQHRKLSSIEQRDVQAKHSRLGRDHGKYAANRALSLLSKMFNVAKDHGEWKQQNPCEGVKRFTEKSRDRFLQPDELTRFLAALDVEKSPLTDAFRLMLFTGARKSNVLTMRWQDLDFDSAVWIVPDTKQNEPQRIPLTSEALAVLKRLKADAKGSEYVFAATRAGTVNPYVTDATKAWKSVCAIADLPKLRMHDLRRTMGSWQALQGTSLITIGKSLGHRNSSTTEIYARLTIDPVREAMEKASAAMAATAKPKAAKSEGIG